METKESILGTMNSALRTFLEKNELSLEDVMNISVRDLNKILSRHTASNDVKAEIKRLRRKLKNRCYAANSRTRRLTESAQVQLARDQLSAENARLKARVALLEKHFERMRGMYDGARHQFDQNDIPLPAAGDIDTSAICQTIDEPNNLDEDDHSDEMDAEIDEGIDETGIQRTPHPTALPLELEDGFSFNSSSTSSTAPNSPSATSGAHRTLKPKTRLLSRFFTDGQSQSDGHSPSNSPRTSESELPSTAAAASLALASQQQQSVPPAYTPTSNTTAANALPWDSAVGTPLLPITARGSVDETKPSIIEHNGQYYVIAPVPGPASASRSAGVPSLSQHLSRQA